MLRNTLPNREELECPFGHTCSKCILYRCMPVDVMDPATGESLKGAHEWDCVLAWIMLGSWDTGRQAQGIHAAVSQQTNETVKRQDQFLTLMEWAASGRGPERLNDASRKA